MRSAPSTRDNASYTTLSLVNPLRRRLSPDLQAPRHQRPVPVAWSAAALKALPGPRHVSPPSVGQANLARAARFGHAFNNLNERPGAWIQVSKVRFVYTIAYFETIMVYTYDHQGIS